MIVDTTFMIDLEREVARGKSGPALRFLEQHEAEILRISVVTFGELAEGYPDPQAPELAELTAPYELVDITKPVAARYAQVSRARRKAGDRWGDNDLWIAATALAAGEPLVTRDRDHFARIESLEVYGY
jgi:predicted nucleic acid-binding protein